MPRRLSALLLPLPVPLQHSAVQRARRGQRRDEPLTFTICVPRPHDGPSAPAPASRPVRLPLPHAAPQQRRRRWPAGLGTWDGTGAPLRADAAVTCLPPKMSSAAEAEIVGP